MVKKLRWLGILGMLWCGQSCSVAPPPDRIVASRETRRMVAQRVSAVVVTGRKDLKSWVSRNFVKSQAPHDADGGSAAPISSDGYFLTADHVLAKLAGRNVFIIYGKGGTLSTAQARVVWRSAADDIAVLHIPLETPNFYRWTAAEKWLPAGSSIVHGGISTGFKGPAGKLSTALAPESLLTGNRKFKMDLPLQPGDSGGPVVDARGGLIGINSSVEFLVPMETAFFIDSEGKRPNTAKIDALIRRDRARGSR
jgi:S1-C subfamily serine protease